MSGSLRTEATLKQVLRFEEVEGISLLGFVAGGQADSLHVLLVR